MMQIPIILPVRKQSQRCPNKILKPFHDSKSLLQIAANKFNTYPFTYIAAHEYEFKEIAKEHNIGFIQRTLESAMSEEMREIHNYLNDINSKYACFVNVCCPLLKPDSVYKAIEIFKKDNDILSVFSVVESHDIIFNANKEVINFDKVFNSKIRRPNYIGNNAFIIFEVERLLKSGSYWNYKPNDPYLFKTSRIESVDIDTVEDFNIAQVLYERYSDDSSI